MYIATVSLVNKSTGIKSEKKVKASNVTDYQKAIDKLSTRYDVTVKKVILK